MPEKRRSGLFTRLKALSPLNPERKARKKLIKQVAASAYYGAIVPALNRWGRYARFSDDMRTKLVLQLSQTWLDNYAPESFPLIDEFVLTTGWTIKTTNYEQHEKHHQLTLPQLGEWIEEQKQNLGIG